MTDLHAPYLSHLALTQARPQSRRRTTLVSSPSLARLATATPIDSRQESAFTAEPLPIACPAAVCSAHRHRQSGNRSCSRYLPK